MYTTTYVFKKSFFFFFFTPRDPRGICNPGTSPIGIEFFREVLRAMPTISLVPTIPSIPLRRKFFSNCATLISSCALRRVPHFIQPPFLPSSSIPSRRFVAARGTDTRGIYTLYEIGKRIQSMQMDTVGRKKELEIERFFSQKININYSVIYS